MEPAQPEEVKLSFPKRPKKSDKFQAREIQLISNHFPLTLASEQSSFCLYDLKILESETEELVPADARLVRTKILKAGKKHLTEWFGENYWVSGLVLWSLKNQADVKSFTVTIKDGEDDKKYDVFLAKAKEINLRSETFQNNETAASFRQYINVLIKRHFRLRKYKEWGMNSKFYDPNDAKPIPQFYLEVYCGFKTSCEIYAENVPKILIDFASRIVRSDSALYYINEAKSTQDAREMLEGRSVIASYGNYRMWRVDAIDFTKSPATKRFRMDDGKEVSILQYYKMKYNIDIEEQNQPLLVNIDRKTGKETILVPSLVQMTGLSEEMKQDPQVMKEVAKFTRLEPANRMQKVRSEAAELSNFFSRDYKMKMELQTPVKGYVLKPPELRLGGNSIIPDKGNYQIRETVFRPAQFNKWVLIYPDACKDDANFFVKTLGKCSGAFGIRVGKPLELEVQGRSPESLKDILRKKVPNDAQIVVCLYPIGAKKHWYKPLKDICLKEKGIPCQAVVSASFKKNEMSVCSKILLQMNAKIGLELWLTSKPQGLPEKTMIIGADVYHKTKVGEELKSCIGFCASLDPAFSRFFSKVSFQKRVGEEIMTSIGRLVKEAVMAYFKFNQKRFLPECIIFFRDGLADNQLKLALEIETKAILDQLKTIDPNYNPKFAEVVVTKRIDDRIFSREEVSRGGRGSSENKEFYNPPAGTVVGEKIVSNNFDYLLVCQNVTQGTCTPTRFNVIYDTTGLPEDVFWQLSYSQSFNYFNWNGSVRVPAPVQYAHKLAYLVGQTVQGEPDDKIADKLYYL